MFNPVTDVLFFLVPLVSIAATLLTYRTDRRRSTLVALGGSVLTTLVWWVLELLGVGNYEVSFVVSVLAAVALVVAFVAARRMSLLLVAASWLVFAIGLVAAGTNNDSVSAGTELTVFLVISFAVAIVALVLALPKRALGAAGSVTAAAPGSQRLSVYAVLSLVFSLVIAPLGVIFGHIALSEIRKTGDRGRGLAIAGLIIGYAWTAGIILLIVIAALHH